MMAAVDIILTAEVRLTAADQKRTRVRPLRICGVIIVGQERDPC
jgi:hypothetical protein